VQDKSTIGISTSQTYQLHKLINLKTSTHKLVNSRNHQLKKSSTQKLINSKTHQLKNSSAHQRTNSYQLTNSPNHQLINSYQLMNSQTHQIIDSKITYSSSQKLKYLFFILQIHSDFHSVLAKI